MTTFDYDIRLCSRDIMADKDCRCVPDALASSHHYLSRWWDYPREERASWRTDSPGTSTGMERALKVNLVNYLYKLSTCLLILLSLQFQLDFVLS
ncbi:hypothetical protein RR48_00344 [Papilio machaon]|uniref:Uncharacterized protein n=1 Tax=Papilio machaon TaxID=76193 RepID=A0A0N0PFH1_PAPMA|nr:hypothetical protein RR48_00344 [Papilio machaon]